MNVTREQIERLKEHAGVSYEDAQAALEASDGDLLDALVWLERMGKIPSSGVHSYATDPRVEPEPAEAAAEEEPPGQEPFSYTLYNLWKWLVDNRLEAYRRNHPDRVLECPIAALVALIVLAWWLVAILLVVGFLFGWRYRFVGPHLGRSQTVQEVMEKIDDGAETVIAQVWRNIRPRR